MRGVLMEATLPVVIRTTCVCPSHLLPAAAERFVKWYLDKSECQSGGARSRTAPPCHLFILFILIYFPGRSLVTAKLNLKFVSANQVSDQF